MSNDFTLEGYTATNTGFKHFPLKINISAILNAKLFIDNLYTVQLQHNNDYQNKNAKTHFQQKQNLIHYKTKLLLYLIDPNFKGNFTQQPNTLSNMVSKLNDTDRRKRSLTTVMAKKTAQHILQSPLIPQLRILFQKFNTSNSLRIGRVLKFLQKTNNLFTTVLSNKTALTQEKAVDTLSQHLDSLSNTFLLSLNDLISGILRLKDNKLSPLLINMDEFILHFNILKKQVIAANYHLISNNPLSAFQATTSHIYENSTLYIVIYLPIYQTPLLSLYRYIPSPTFINNSFALKIASEYSYIALDSTGTFVLQFTEKQLQLCKKLDTMYYCPNNGILNKNVQSMCLYNLFYRNINKITDTCSVYIHDFNQHAIQLSGHTFRLHAPTETQINIICINQDVKKEVVKGTYILRLNNTCPSANTNTQLFLLNNNTPMKNIELSPSKAITWLPKKDIFSSINISQELQTLKTKYGQKVTLHQLQNHIDNMPYNTFEKVNHYTQTGLALLAILYIVYALMTNCCKIVAQPVYDRYRTNSFTNVYCFNRSPPPQQQITSNVI